MTIGERIKLRRESLNISQEELAKRLGYKSRSSINKIELGINDLTQSKIKAIADILETTPAYIMGWSDDSTSTSVETSPSNTIFLDDKKIHMIPLFETVSAGFGTYAANEIIGYMPCYLSTDAEASETLYIKVSGDSMYPKIEDGDIIQVHKQSSVDSGSIAVILLDKTEGLVKKVIYGEDWIELHSINPMYPVQRFSGEQITRLEILGLVKRITKDV